MTYILSAFANPYLNWWTVGESEEQARERWEAAVGKAFPKPLYRVVVRRKMPNLAA